MRRTLLASAFTLLFALPALAQQPTRLGDIAGLQGRISSTAV